MLLHKLLFAMKQGCSLRNQLRWRWGPKRKIFSALHSGRMIGGTSPSFCHQFFLVCVPEGKIGVEFSSREAWENFYEVEVHADLASFEIRGSAEGWGGGSRIKFFTWSWWRGVEGSYASNGGSLLSVRVWEKSDYHEDQDTSSLPNSEECFGHWSIFRNTQQHRGWG